MLYIKGTAKSTHPKGVTGVIGIQDCTVGGERIVFPEVDRSKVEDVQRVVTE